MSCFWATMARGVVVRLAPHRASLPRILRSAGAGIALVACGGAPQSAPSPGEALPRVLAPVSAPSVPTRALPLTKPADAPGTTPPRAEVEISAGGAKLRLSRFEPTVAIRADGQRIALILEEPDGGVAVLFDATTGAELRRWLPPGGTGWGAGFDALQFLPDGRLLAVERRRLHVLSEDGSIEQLWEGGIALASPDGRWVASLGPDGLSIRSFGGAPIALDRKLRRLQTLAFNSAGTRLAVVRNGSTDDQPTGDTDIVIYEQHAGSWRRAARHTVFGARQENDAAFLSRDRLLVDFQVIDLASGAVAPAPAIGLSAVSADGQTLLFNGGDGTAQWARIVDGELGPLVDAVRPQAFANRGLPVAISPQAQVLWCTGTACGLGLEPR